ncbi:MAG TPA: Ig-like domain-containing protein [Candidatus Limnocylindrales bacterium]|jgi:Flp pilus assembly protein TadG
MTLHLEPTNLPQGAAGAVDRARNQRGQTIVLLALVMVAVIAMAGLLLDGGTALSNQRKAQSAADTAALAGALAKTQGNTVAALTAAARALASQNGYAPDLVTCSGTVLAGRGVVVNDPPATPDPHHGDSNYVEVIISKAMRTTFAGVVGQRCWMVSARAVALAANKAVAPCNFCSLNNSTKNHTLLLQNSSSLRVDGDIYVNSTNGCVNVVVVNGLNGCSDGTTCALKSYNVCGDGFDVFGTPPAGTTASISAKTISVVGGWETHDGNLAAADGPLQTGCVDPNPPSQPGPPNSYVCVHMPPLVDPLGGVDPPNTTTLSVPTSTSCPAAPGTTGVTPAAGTLLSPNLTTPTGSTTLCPGIYYGGISISGSTTHVVMQAGIYDMLGNGFAVINGASVDGSAGVMIYNSHGSGGADIAPDPDLADDPNPAHPTPLVAITSNVAGNVANVPTTGTQSVTVTFTFNVQHPAGVNTHFNGTVTFYDGATAIPGCVFTFVDQGNPKPQCHVTYTSAAIGTHGVAAVYSGDPTYNDAEDILNPALVVQINGAPVAGPVTISTTGTVRLSGMTSGPYQGFTIFQDRNSSLNLTISPGASGLPACSATFMTDEPPPSPCGALGGIQGTLYSPNQDSVAQITASGLTNLQLMAGKILITSDAKTRFAFTPGNFAFGAIRLVE